MHQPTRREAHARLIAALIAGGSFIGLIPPFQLMLAEGIGLGEAVWHLLRPFTIITNLLIVVVFGAIAWRGTARVAPLLVGAVMLAILLVGIIFNLVLGQIPQLNWWTFLGDSLHHHVAPIAVPLWWLAYAPHGTLRWYAPLVWAVYPLAYSAYSLTRAAFEPESPFRYPYFFMDVEALGWGGVLANLAVISIAFMVVGYLFLLLDRRLGSGTPRGADAIARNV